MPFRGSWSIKKAFTLIEILIVVGIIAILTAGAIPSFNDFTRSQILIQAFKTLKSDLRVAQSRSLSGATSGVSQASQAWGLYFDTGSSGRYQIITCTPVSQVVDYYKYQLGGAGSVCSSARIVSLNSGLALCSLRKDGSPVSVLNVVFDTQSGLIVANGSTVSSAVTVGLDYSTCGGSPQTITITPAGGIGD